MLSVRKKIIRANKKIPEMKEEDFINCLKVCQLKISQNLLKIFNENFFDKDGNQTGNMVIQIGSDNFKKFQQFIYPYATIEHDVTIFKIPYSEVIGKLTGSEILEIDWMLEDSDKPADN